MYNDIVTLISNIGFPIVAFYLMYKQNNDYIDKTRDTINKNTTAINKLLQKLESEVINEDK